MLPLIECGQYEKDGHYQNHAQVGKKEAALKLNLLKNIISIVVTLISICVVIYNVAVTPAISYRSSHRRCSPK